MIEISTLLIVYDTATGNIILRRGQSTEIGDNAIVSGKIAAGAVLSGNIASGQIGGNHFASGAIGQSVLADGAVVSAKIGASIVGPVHLQSGFIPMTVLQSGTLLPLIGGHLDMSSSSNRRVGINQTNGNLLLVGGNDDLLDAYWSLYGRAAAGASGQAVLYGPTANALGRVARITVNPGNQGAGLVTLVDPLAVNVGLGVGAAAPTVSGRIAVGEQVDGVDISAHTHTGGAGDAANIQSGGIGSGQIGETHLASGVHSVVPAGNIQSVGFTPYHLPGVCLVSMTGVANAGEADTIYYYPICTPTKIAVDQIAMSIASGPISAYVRMNIYQASEFWQPVGPPLLADQEVNISGGAMAKVAVAISSVILSAGRYLLARNLSSLASGKVGTIPRRGGVPGAMLDGNLIGGDFFTTLKVANDYAAFGSGGPPWTDRNNGSTPFVYEMVLRVMSGFV